LSAAGFEAKASEGSSSQFDVVRDGTIVFSKQQVRRFPEPGEVLALLQR
jgi:Rdx family protein